MLVENLGLGETLGDPRWTLRVLWADATKSESGEGGKTPAAGLTKLHTMGYVDKINVRCKLVRGQKSHQTRIWPVDLESGDAIDSLESLILYGISYTPRSLILDFGQLDLQVTLHFFDFLENTHHIIGILVDPLFTPILYTHGVVRFPTGSQGKQGKSCFGP